MANKHTPGAASEFGDACKFAANGEFDVRRFEACRQIGIVMPISSVLEITNMFVIQSIFRHEYQEGIE
jgi:hypothetical protein